MSNEALKEQLSGLNSLGKELALKFSLFSHTRQANHRLDMLLDIQRIDTALQEARETIKHCAENSLSEDRCLKQIRALEDQRFQLLSELNGEDISGYAAL